MTKEETAFLFGMENLEKDKANYPVLPRIDPVSGLNETEYCISLDDTMSDPVAVKSTKKRSSHSATAAKKELKKTRATKSSLLADYSW
jgi:hypothetical protein